MRYIDRPDVPGPLMRALTDPKYMESLVDHFSDLPDEVKGMRSLSATTLPRSPRQRILEMRHGGKLLLDPVKDGFWKMFGSMIHLLLERYGDTDDLIEQRLGITVAGTYVHGQADRYSPSKKRLQDYKITKAASMLYGGKEEYHAQLNILGFIFRKHGHQVELLQNIYIFRDFDPRQVKEGTLYPKDHFQIDEVPIWSDEKIINYIKTRTANHVNAEVFKDDELPFCNDQERWMGLPTFLAYKVDLKKNEAGEKVPVRQSKSKFRSNSRLDLELWMQEPANAFNRLKVKGKVTEDINEDDPITYEVVERKATPTRCGYCHFYDFCNQRKAEVAAQSTDADAEEPEE